MLVGTGPKRALRMGLENAHLTRLFEKRPIKPSVVPKRRVLAKTLRIPELS
jgi:hypothetical protein